MRAELVLSCGHRVKSRIQVRKVEHMDDSGRNGHVDSLGPNPVAGGARYYFSTAEARASAEPHVEALRREGYVILRDQLPPEKLEALAADFERLEGAAAMGRTDFEGMKSKRVYNPLAKTRALDDLILHPAVTAIAEAYLDDQIQLSSATSVNIHPGETPQTLHRDDDYYPLPRPHIPLSVTTMWALDDFTEENGATRIVPRSHLLTGKESVPPQSIPAEMPKGSVMLWDGSLLHGGGGNPGQSPRLGFIGLYSRAWLRAQDNMFLSIPREILRELPRRLQYLLGFWVTNNFLGVVENRSPLRAIS